MSRPLIQTGQPLRKEASSRGGVLPFTLLCFLLSAAWLSCSAPEAGHSVTGGDSLSASRTTDSVFIIGLLENAWKWRAKNPDSSFYYAAEAEQQARTKNYPALEAQAHCRLANIDEDKGANASAHDHFLAALSLDSSVHNKHGIARDYYSLANLLKKGGRYDDAKSYTKRAMDIWGSLPDTASLENFATATNNLGNILMREGDADSALLCFQQTDSIATKSGNLRIKAEATNGIGYVYEKAQAYDKAMAMYRSTLAIEEQRMNKRGIAIASNNIGGIYYLQDSLPQALAWYQESLRLKEEIQYTAGAAGTYTNIGSIYEARGDFQQALRYHLKSHSMQSESGEVQETAISANNVALVLRRLGREQEALLYFEQALDLAQQSGGKIIELEILAHMTEAASASGNYHLAFRYADRQRQIRDTIDEHLREADLIDERYREQKNAYELLEIENEAERQRSIAESAKQQTVVYTLVAGIAMIVLSFLAWWKINREKHRAIVAEQQEQINRQHTEEIIRKQELIVLRSIFDAQQKERQRIATDLHDGLSLKLSTARLYYNLVGKLATGMNEEERKQYTKGHEILDEASTELREVAHDLLSGKITRFGLAQAIERLCETLQEASELKIDFYSSGLDNRLDSHSEFQVYQIIQELLTNIHRHAKARNATVQLSRYNHTLNVLVEDDGLGFPEKCTSRKQA